MPSLSSSKFKAERIGISLEKLNNKLSNLLEENKRLKQQHKDLQEENQRINSDFGEKLQEKDEQLEKLQQKVSNLETQKNEFEIISQTLEKTLELLELGGEQNNSQTLTFPLNDNDSIQLAKNFTNSSKHSWSSYNKDNIRIVVGLDFGTTYSGFAYSHVINPQNIIAHDHWREYSGFSKINTVLKYDDEYENVISWGATALAEKPTRRKKVGSVPPIELFKLHLSDLPNKFKPKLPLSLDYKKVITDYLREIGKVMKEAIVMKWPNTDLFKNVLLVLTFPAEYSEKARSTMRECVYNAGLINDINSTTLQFITEPAAISNFMVVDCGGGTVDLTTRKLINRNHLGEITERSGDFCGSTYIDKEFIIYLSRKLGHSAMELLKENHYGQMQNLIQEFNRQCKFQFTGEVQSFRPYNLYLDDTIPVIKQYITGENRAILEETEWEVELGFNDIKSMFDPVVEKILRLIHAQLDSSLETCSAMFLVGGLSESKYLQKRIKQEFQHIVRIISIPSKPMVAIERGAVMYGLSMNSDSNVIASRILKYTYGVKVRKFWTKDDPIHRKVHDGRIDKFDCLAKRGTPMNVNQEITCTYLPLYPTQTKVVFYLYYTQEYDAQYCDEPGMKLLGKLNMDLPGAGLDKLSFGLAFGQMEVTATVKNETNEQKSKINFEFDV
ncbi:12961_t:CDS:2 [Funneliformis mosseae]|uniref:12961_t:CDS:1 n=1 Tax=Funneliformis mosseae TaxID=27381 RepID=A0A9N8VTW9_FUNMO|nr:12961_t:CDS:2 [Funneliformis mosseae]